MSEHDSEQKRYGRELEEDHDLLTFNESSARLRQEVETTQATLAELSSDDPAVPALKERLDQLVESQARIKAEIQNNSDGRGFAEYQPQQP